ncbi:hypothetical protein ACFC58_06675 [Kitasatospora purpeofusca]|uniref:hypothetical protein n=1 Tax=Kitasatospora purpeofusca TaxID=67352 RepID=UPI0035D5580A
MDSMHHTPEAAPERPPHERIDTRAPRFEAREVHPAPASTDRVGRRVPSPAPYAQPGNEQHVLRNFGRPHSGEGVQ